jgi:hypothetical protein
MDAGLLQMKSLSLEPPCDRPHGAGEWSGHVPFAYDLVAAMRPSMIVELGTHYGESYFAFCQAIVECGVVCKSFAIDTWRGDLNTGAYGEAVFREVSAYNQQHYATFSTLVRSHFDDALDQYPNGSIDLLHIDGLHMYEAVRHDFDVWSPKVRPGGIILLHDTQIRRDDFGVWRLWTELCGRYESFEFPHSCGLGVIRRPGGLRAQAGLESLLFKSEEQVEAVRRFYLICGERLQLKDRAERQQRIGKWELLSKFYWRGEGEQFLEQRCIHMRREVSAMREEIRFELPCDTSCEQLRVDLLESPLFMRIYAIRLLGVQDELLWSLPMKDAEDLVCVGLRFTAESDDCGLAARLADEPASILLNIPRTVLGTAVAGRSLLLEMSGLKAEEYAATLNAMLQHFRTRAVAAESNLAVSPSELTALTRGLAEAQDLVLKQQEELGMYVCALSEAQRLASERETELKDLANHNRSVTEALKTSEQSLAGLDARILNLLDILAQTRMELTGREEQICDIAARFSEAESQNAVGRQELSQACEELQRRSAALLEVQRLYRDCSQRLREVETSLTWRLTRPLRTLPKF